MPRVNLAPTHPMTRLLRGYEINGKNLSKCLGCAEETARKKILDPRKLTVGDILAIHHGYGIPLDDLKAAMT